MAEMSSGFITARIYPIGKLFGGMMVSRGWVRWRIWHLVENPQSCIFGGWIEEVDNIDTWGYMCYLVNIEVVE